MFIAPVKLTIAVYLRNFLRKIVNENSAGMTSAYLQTLMSIFFQALTTPTLEFHIKKHLYNIFESLLLMYQTTETSNAKIQEFYSQLFTSI